MYQFISAVAIGRSIGSQWETVDLSSILVYDIFNNYSQVYLTLSTPAQTNPLYVNMDSLRTEFSSYGNTLTQLLIDLGNRTLETVAALPDTTIKYARYSDAFRAKYKIGLTKIGFNLPDNYPDTEKPDLILTRPSVATDLSLIHSYCLVSVNGFYHRTDADASSAYVYDGATTYRKSRTNQLGILSFLDIGKVEKLPIPVESIHTPDSDSSLYQRTYFSVTADTTNKSVILCLGGYLVFPEAGVFWAVGDNTFAINFQRLPMLQRYFESNEYLDLSSLQLQVSSDNPSMVNVPDLFSDDVLKRYLTLSQSFLITVDTPHLFTNKISIRASKVPGMFTTYQDPRYPLIVNYGKVAEYWKVEEDTYWAMSVQDKAFKNFVFSYSPVKDLMNITPNAMPEFPYQKTNAFLLEIGGY